MPTHRLEIFIQDRWDSNFSPGRRVVDDTIQARLAMLKVLHKMGKRPSADVVMQDLTDALLNSVPLSLREAAGSVWPYLFITFYPPPTKIQVSNLGESALGYNGAFHATTPHDPRVQQVVAELNKTCSVAIRIVKEPSLTECQNSALLSAAWSGSYNALLLRYQDMGIARELGAQRRIGSERRTLLHIAAARHHVELAKKLIEDGSEIDAITNRGVTPLVAAVRSRLRDKRQRAMIALLLAHGADPLRRSASGCWRGGRGGFESALSLAVTNVAAVTGDLSIAHLLIAHVADRHPRFGRAVWEVIISRFLTGEVPDGTLAYVGGGLLRDGHRGRTRCPPPLFSDLLELLGGLDNYYDAASRVLLGRQTLDAQLPPDCGAELGDQQGGVDPAALEQLDHRHYADACMNFAMTRVGISHYWTYEGTRQLCVAISMQRPGVYDLPV